MNSATVKIRNLFTRTPDCCFSLKGKPKMQTFNMPLDTSLYIFNDACKFQNDSSYTSSLLNSQKTHVTSESSGSFFMRA